MFWTKKILKRMCSYNEKASAQDNKKRHKRSLSSPISFVNNYSNARKSGERISKNINGIFSHKRVKNLNREAMAGAISDDPSMSRMVNNIPLNGSPYFNANGTDSEFDTNIGHSAIQLHHQKSMVNGLPSELNDNDPDGKVKKKFQSSWDLTPKEIAKNEKKRKKKQRASVKLQKGLKELMHLADPLMTKEQTTLGEPTMKNLVQRKDLNKDSPKSSENDDLNGLLMEKEPLSQRTSVNGIHCNEPEANNNIEGEVNQVESSHKKRKSEKFEIPPPHKGKTLVDTVIDNDVETLFQSTFENDIFFEMVSKQAIDEVKNFESPPWGANEEGKQFRVISWQFVKTVMMTRNVIQSKQSQTKSTAIPGKMYIIDAVTDNSGIMYADYIRVWLQWRFIREDLFNGDRTVKENKKKTHLQITYDIEFVKACLMKGKIETETKDNLKRYYEVVEQELKSEERVRERIRSSGQSAIKHSNGHVPTQRGKHATRKTPADNIHKAHPTVSQPIRSETRSDDIAALRERFQYRENLLTCACILLLITMVFTTLAMYKLSSTISILNERMNQIEQSTALHHRHQDEFLKSLRTQNLNS